MNEKELKQFKAALLNSVGKFILSKMLPVQLLDKFGLLTRGGDLKKYFKPAPGVSS